MTQMLVATKPTQIQTTSYILFGSIGVGFGLLLYYVLPRALLTFDLRTMGNLSLSILVALLAGLCLLAYNLQFAVELQLLKIYLFFEPDSLKMLVKDNLKHHRRGSRLTALVYTLAFASVIFLVSTQALVLETFEKGEIKYKASYLYLEASYPNILAPKIMDPIFKKNKDIIEEFSFITPHLANVVDGKVKKT